jgi:hypothetical protein
MMLSVFAGDDEVGMEERRVERPVRGRKPTPEEFAAMIARAMGREDTPNAQMAIGLARFVANVMG